MRSNIGGSPEASMDRMGREVFLDRIIGLIRHHGQHCVVEFRQALIPSG